MTQTATKKILAIDWGAEKGITAIFYNDYQNGAVFKDGKSAIHCKNTDYKAQISFIRNWIDRLEVNYIIYEGRAEGKEVIFDRESMWTMWKMFKTIILYCHQRKIAGCRVEPYELINYRKEKGYLESKITEREWIEKKGLKRVDGSWLEEKELPLDWKEEAKKEGYVWIGKEEDHELDATCLWELWAEKIHSRGDYPSCYCNKSKLDKFGKLILCATCWLKQREELHWKYPTYIVKADNTKISNSEDAYNRKQKYKSNSQ